MTGSVHIAAVMLILLHNVDGAINSKLELVTTVSAQMIPTTQNLATINGHIGMFVNNKTGWTDKSVIMYLDSTLPYDTFDESEYRIGGLPINSASSSNYCENIVNYEAKEYHAAMCCYGYAMIIDMRSETNPVWNIGGIVNPCRQVVTWIGFVIVLYESNVLEVYSDPQNTGSYLFKARRTLTTEKPTTITAYAGVLYWAEIGSRVVNTLSVATLEPVTPASHTLPYPVGYLGTFYISSAPVDYLCATTTNPIASFTSLACYKLYTHGWDI